MRAFKLLFARLAVGLALFIVAAAATVFALSRNKLNHRYSLVVASVAVPGDPESNQRGRHIATVRGCLTCHGSDFGGAMVMNNGAMGCVYGPNLTTGKGGIASRLKNEDWVRAVREGVGSDGHPLFIMPSKDFVGLTDEDLGAILAFANSATPVDREVPAISVGPVSRVLIALGKLKLSAEVIDHSRAPGIAPIRVEVSPAYGRYLASTCSGCHNSSFSGGKIVEGPPDWPPAANLTHGSGSAVAGWTESDFIRAIREGKTPLGAPVNPVMPRVFGQMTDLELRAIWSYFQTLPATATGKSASTGT